MLIGIGSNQALGASQIHPVPHTDEDRPHVAAGAQHGADLLVSHAQGRP